MSEKVTVKIKMLEGTDDLRPAKAHHDDAAFDLKSRVEMELKPGEPHVVPTGVFMEIPPDSRRRSDQEAGSLSNMPSQF